MLTHDVLVRLDHVHGPEDAAVPALAHPDKLKKQEVRRWI
jgi:hypothetical protein